MLLYQLAWHFVLWAMLILPLRAIFKATRAASAYALKRGLKIAVLLACGLLMQFLERAGSFLRMRNSERWGACSSDGWCDLLRWAYTGDKAYTYSRGRA